MAARTSTAYRAFCDHGECLWSGSLVDSPQLAFGQLDDHTAAEHPELRRSIGGIEDSED